MFEQKESVISYTRAVFITLPIYILYHYLFCRAIFNLFTDSFFVRK